jgi:hypothetical protein
VLITHGCLATMLSRLHYPMGKVGSRFPKLLLNNYLKNIVVDILVFSVANLQ